MSEQFKISLGVDLNTSDIQGQIDSIETKVEPIKINIDLNHTQQQVNKIKQQIQSLNNVKVNLGAGTSSNSGVNKSVNEITTAYNKLKNISKNIGSIKIKLNGLDTSKDIQQIKILERQLQSLTKEYHDTVSKIKNKGDLSSTQWQTVQHQIDNTKLKLEQLSGKIIDAKNKLAKNIQIKLDDNTFSNDISNIESKFNKLSNKSDDVRTGINNVKRALSDMHTAAAKGDIEGLINANERYERVLKDVNNQLKINTRAEKDNAAAASLDLRRQGLSSDIDKWLKDNSAAASQFGARLREIQAQIKTCDATGLSRLRSQFNNVKKEAELAGKATQTLGDRLRAQFSRYSAYLSVASVFMYTTMAMRDMFNQVVAIDSAMTELKKVTDETNETYDEFLTNAASRASEIGTTIDGLVSSTADFARLGYEFSDAAGLAEIANIYTVVGDEIDGIDTATQSLISTMKAFKEEAGGLSESEFALGIVDKMNEVSNNFAISSGGIGEALTRSASSLAAANNTLDESIALITASNTVVQDPTVVGTALKTISMRIRGAKTEMEEAGLETDGMASSTAKLREEIMALSGVDIMLDNDTFKSTYQIIEELSAKWKDLSDIQQASITELIAGKRQGNIVSSLMENFDIAQAALETSQTSAGSAMKEHEKWLQSLEAKINQLKAAWQGLSQAFMKSDFLKGALDSIVTLVEGLAKLVDTIGVLPTLFTAFAAFRGFSGKGIFKVIEDEAALSGKRITNIFKQSASDLNFAMKNIGLQVDSSFKSSLKNDIAALHNYKNAVQGGLSSTEALSRYMNKASESARVYAQSKQFAAQGVEGFVKQQKSAQVATLAQNKSLSNARGIIKEYYNGCKNVGMGQKDFAAAVNQTNPALAKQLTSANSVKGAMAGYVTSLIGAKAASIGLTIATTAMNAAITMGVSLLISWGISKLDEWIVTADELAEKIDEVTSKYKEQHRELNKLKGDYDTSKEDSMISRYGELSKGVDSLGENISLTAAEYEEYQNIVGQIASQFPELVTGFNSQGDAILSCAGNVDTLAESYRNLLLETNKDVLDADEDIFDDFSNKMKKLRSSRDEMTTYSAEALENLLSSNDLEKGLAGISNDDLPRIVKLLEDKGFERDVLGSGKKGFETQREFIARVMEEDRAAVKAALDGSLEDINAYTEELNTLVEAYFSTEFLTDYSHMSEKMQSIITQTASSFDAEFYSQFTSAEDLEKYLDTILSAFDDLGAGETANLEAAFDLQTKFNNGQVSYGEYVDGIKKAENIISSLGLDPEIESGIKLALNTEEVTKNYNALKERLTSEEYDIQMNADEAEEFLNGLSASEYAVALDLIVNGDINLSDFDIDSLRKYIEEQAKLNEAMNFTIAIDVEAESIEALNTAMAESVSGAGLSSEAIAALKGRYAELKAEGYDLSTMFEETANGIHLNREAVGELEQALASNKLSETDGHLETLKGRYDELAEKIDNCTDAGERANLYSEQQQVAQKINDLATLASQYEGLTSAYKAWQDAESAGSERDMYENILKGFENIDDEISRGWVDDGTVKFLELLSGKELSTAPIEELKKAYDGLDDTIKNTSYSVRDFFTVDDEGNSTNAGVYNFLDAVGQLEEEKFGGKDVVKRDKDGNIISFDFGIAGGDEAIAEALGISEELVQIMVRAADDAGFVVTLDGNYTQLADLKTSAEEANAELKKLGKTDIDFNFGANNLEDLNTELGKSMEVLEQFRNKDGTINMEMEGAEDALEIASYFTATIDKLTEPVYMQLETNQVEKNLQEPLTKMQEFERLSKEKHQLKLTGDKKGLKEVNAEMDEIAEFLEGLDEETKIDLDIDGLSQKEIKNKLEKGEIEIPATVDIQMEMSDDIKDMRLLMMNQLGLASDDEVKLKIGYEIDDSLVDRLSDEEKEVVIKYIEENEDVWDKYSKEEREAVVKIIADGTDIESWEAKEKKALVKYVVDGGAVDSWTPEEKQAFAKYLVDGGNVDGWTPEAKDAFVKYLVDGGDPDKFDPEDKESWVVYKKDSKEPDGYKPPPKDQKVTAELNSKAVDGYNPSPKTLTVKAVLKKTWSNIKQALGFGGANGTANIGGTAVSINAFANGTTGRAYKQGDWSIKDSGTALGGELGAETIVRNGRFFTIGDHGAEFFKYKKGDIIFNHKQTEELFKNGRVTSGGGHGRAFAEGTAFSSGSGGWGKVGGNSVTTTTTTTTTTKTSSSKSSSKSSSSSKKSSSKKSSSKKTKDEFEETFDWIEIAIDRIERAIDQLDLKANSIYKKWSTRNSALVDEIGKVEDEIALQQKAYDRYIKEANSVGLSSSYAQKVREGKIDIQTIKDESLAEKIKEYQEWYEKALDCKDAVEELKEKESELYKQRFDNVSTQYEGILSIVEHEKNMLEEYISQTESNAMLVSANYYKALVGNERETIEKLEKQKAEMLKALNTAVASGKIAENSEAWYEMVAAVDEVTLSIAKSNTQIIEWNQTLQQLSWEVFDILQDRISGVAEEAEFLIELMSSDKLYSDNGQLTDEGSATMGLHGQNYNVYMAQADKYAKEVAKLNKEIKKDPYDQDLINRRDELLELQRESILAAQDEKEAIRDMVEEGIELELDALQERIDKYNEALDSQKDLYDYQKKVKEQTEEIASLEKQISSYGGDISEETKAKVQELKVSLEEVKSDLEETEYDKYISDQQQLLDELYLEYETILNTRLDNIDALLADMISEINTDASSISATISENAESVGYTLTESMKTIWNENSVDTKNVITTYGEKFASAQTTTNSALNTINVNLQNMITQLNKIAKTNVKSASTSSASNSKEASGSKKPSSSSGTTTKPTTSTTASSAKTIKTGGKINAKGAKIYDYAGDKSGEHQYYYKDPIYKVLKTSGNWLQVRWHKLSKGITGWFKKGDVKAYKTGTRRILNNEFAWTQEAGKEFIVRPSDGAILTPLAKNDSVLDANASGNIWNIANSPSEFIKENLGLDASGIPNNLNTQNTYTQNLDKVVFNLPNVKNYEELLTAMQKDKNFEKLILSMSIDRLAGKSALGKNKAIR